MVLTEPRRLQQVVPTPIPTNSAAVSHDMHQAPSGLYETLNPQLLLLIPPGSMHVQRLLSVCKSLALQKINHCL